MVDPLSWQTQIVDPQTGTPTQAFLSLWQQLVGLGLGDLVDVSLGTPSDGQVLTYSAAQGKWIPS